MKYRSRLFDLDLFKHYEVPPLEVQYTGTRHALNLIHGQFDHESFKTYQLGAVFYVAHRYAYARHLARCLYLFERTFMPVVVGYHVQTCRATVVGVKLSGDFDSLPYYAVFVFRSPVQNASFEAVFTGSLHASASAEWKYTAVKAGPV